MAFVIGGEKTREKRIDQALRTARTRRKVRKAEGQSSDEHRQEGTQASDERDPQICEGVRS